jgi:hypothetical protein
MKKIISYFGIALVIVGFAFLAGCTTEGAKPAKEEVKTQASASDIVTQPGYYEDKFLGFSIGYLKDIFTEENDLEEGVVLFREHAQKVPSLVVRVEDIPEGVVLDKIGESFLEDFKADNADSDRFRLIESKMVKLKTGVDANATLLKWRYQGAVPLYTAVVSAYKNNKVIHVLVTSVPGQPTVENLMLMAMALKVTP